MASLPGIPMAKNAALNSIATAWPPTGRNSPGGDLYPHPRLHGKKLPEFPGKFPRGG